MADIPTPLLVVLILMNTWYIWLPTILFIWAVCRFTRRR